MTRQAMERRKEELRKNGFRPWSWGDFWNTGYLANEAKRVGWGFHISSSRSDPLIWDIERGPLGGTWIRWRRQSKAEDYEYNELHLPF